MTETSDNVRSIQGEQHDAPESAWATFNGTRVELTGPLPDVGDVVEATVRFRCKSKGFGEVGDKVRRVVTLKAVKVVPGEITKAADLQDPQLFDGEDVDDDVAEG